MVQAPFLFLRFSRPTSSPANFPCVLPRPDGAGEAWLLRRDYGSTGFSNAQEGTIQDGTVRNNSCFGKQRVPRQVSTSATLSHVCFQALFGTSPTRGRRPSWPRYISAALCSADERKRILCARTSDDDGGRAVRRFRRSPAAAA